MRHWTVCLTLLSSCSLTTPFLGAALAQASDPFERHFTGRCLRFDYYHTGTAGEEHVSVDRLRLEGDWGGRRHPLLDPLDLGKYRFEVIDPSTHLAIYSAGFSSIYGEWETTGEARRGTWRTLHESQRFPEPRHPVQIVLKKRAADGTFREIFSTLADPASRWVDRSPLDQQGEVWAVFEHGPRSEKVDLLVLGDGYTREEMPSYRADVRRVVDALFAHSPFADHREDFNVWAIDVASERSGVSQPRTGFWNRTPIGLTYNAFDSERYMLSFENRRFQEIAALAPFDALILIGNSEQYGGGGTYNLYSTAAAKSGQLPYLIVHEFAHAFAGLGDEYYTSQVAYEDFTAPGTEPWSPNVTALLDPERLKWQALVDADTPTPTPWDQEAYDSTSLALQETRQALRAQKVSEQRMEQYFQEAKEATSRILEAQQYYGKVGAFEGAGYQAKGLYRPAVDCIMFTRNPDYFCPVCLRAIERIIDLHTGRWTP